MARGSGEPRNGPRRVRRPKPGGGSLNERTFNPENTWKLDDPERLKWLPPDDIVSRFGLKPGEIVADIGAGTGYFAIPMAARIAPGMVYAVDFQPGMLERLRARLAAAGDPPNIEPIRGEASATTLPDASVDFVLLANVWHEVDDREGVLREAGRIARESARIAILDWRTGVSRPPGPPFEHRVPVEETVRLLEANRWSVVATAEYPFHYLLVADRLAG
jgi:SAM-dependent methyltransferase